LLPDDRRPSNYATNFRTVDGIAVPFTRRIYGYDDARQKVPEPLLVSLDVHDLQFR
jgi:hypothetical protein